MKIFSQITKKENIYQSYIDLIKSDLPLKDKMKYIKDSYQELILDPDAFNFIIQYIFEKNGYNCRFSRKGDNNERFDMLITKDKNNGLVEIEIPSTQMLDTPRNLLDDIAVSVNRRGFEKKTITPIVVCWTYPNKRTDYWKVLEDINKVLNIQIKTFSVMSLLCIYLLNIDLDITNDSYFLNINNLKLSFLEEKLIEKGVDTSEFIGFFSNIK